MSEENIYAYAAGLIDGEGTITLSRINSGEYRSPAISVASTTFDLLEFMQTNFGGYISAKKKQKESHKDSWHWRVVNNGALELLSKITKHLREPAKKRRAEILLNEYKSVTPRNGKYSGEQRRTKLAFEERFFAR